MKKAIIFLLALSCLLFFAACNEEPVSKLFDKEIVDGVKKISNEAEFSAWTNYGGPAYLTNDLIVYGSYDLAPGEGGSDFNLDLKGHTLTFGNPADLSKGLEPLKKAKKASTAKVTVVSTVKLEIKSTNDTGAAVTAQIKVEKDTSDDADKKQGTLILNEGGNVGLEGVDVENNGGDAPLFANTEGGKMSITDSTLTSSPTDNSTPSNIIMTDSGEVTLDNVSAETEEGKSLIQLVNDVNSVLTSDTDATEPIGSPEVNLIDSLKDSTGTDLVQSTHSTAAAVTVTSTITLTPTSLSIKVGQTATFTPSITRPGDWTLIWTVSRNDVASVSDQGVVTALKQGKATVRATVEGKSNVYAECPITIVSNLTPSDCAYYGNSRIFQDTTYGEDPTIKKIVFQANQEWNSSFYDIHDKLYGESNNPIWYARGTTATDDFDTMYIRTSAKVIVFNSDSLRYFCDGLSYIESVEFNGVLDTSQVKELGNYYNGIFKDCVNLKSVDLSSLDLSKVTTLEKMFYNCKSLESVNFGYSLSDASVVNVIDLFNNCCELTSADLSNISFDTSKTLSTHSMFINCRKIESIILPDTFKFVDGGYIFNHGFAIDSGSAVVYFNDIDNFKNNSTNQIATYMYGNSYSYDYSTKGQIKVNFSYITRLADSNELAAFTELLNPYVSSNSPENIVFKANVKMPEYFRVVTDTDHLDADKFAHRYSTYNFQSDPYFFDSLAPIWFTYDESTKTVFINTSGSKFLFLEGYCLFNGSSTSNPLVSVKKINFNNVCDFTESKNFRDFFFWCENLETIEGWDFVVTDKTTSLFLMFGECHKLTSLDLSTFDTSNVTNFEQVFRGCQNLTSTDLSSWDTSKATTFALLFDDCAKLKSITLGENFTIPSGAKVDNIFRGILGTDDTEQDPVVITLKGNDTSALKTQLEEIISGVYAAKLVEGTPANTIKFYYTGR